MGDEGKWYFKGYELEKRPCCSFHTDGEDCFIENTEGVFSVSVQESIKRMNKGDDIKVVYSPQGIKIVLYFQKDEERPFVLFQIQHEKAQTLFGQIVFRNDMPAREGIKIPAIRQIFEKLDIKADKIGYCSI